MKKYIDLDDVRKDPVKQFVDSAAIMMDFLENRVPAADVVPAQRWISVKKRLPDVEQDVFVYTVSGTREACWLTSDGYWQASARMLDKDSVTHWMPQPEPPKEGEEK